MSILTTETKTEGTGGSATATSDVGAQGGQQAVGTAVSGGSNSNSSWKDSLPDEMKSNGAIVNFQSVGDLAKAYISAQGAISKKGVIVPGEKATDEEWQGFHKAIGVPDLDKYELDLPKDKQMNEAVVNDFKTISHKAGLRPKQAQMIMQWHMDGEEKAMAAGKVAKENQIKEQIEGLKKEWGEGYSKQLMYAQSAVKELGGDELSAYLDKTGLGNDVQLIKLLSKAGKLLKEDQLHGEGSGSFGKTPNEIVTEHNELSRKLLQMKKNDPQYLTVSKRVEELAKKRWGS